MKKIFLYIITIIILISIIILGKKILIKDDTTLRGKEVIYEFFDCYEKKEYKNVYNLVTLKFKEKYLSNIESRIFGINEFELLSCELDEYYTSEYQQQNERETLVYYCKFNMTPADISTYDKSENEAEFFLELEFINDNWVISGYFTG